MDEQQREALDELVVSCLGAVEDGGPAALESFCAEHPEHADALRSRMRALLEAGLMSEPDAPPERLGDFRIGRRLGGGGMGVVYAAVQESLDREVALKVVRADQLYFPGARERFRREVQLVARLAHAGIVPVFTVGEEGGVPYFAMERLQGATLSEALATLDEPLRQGEQLAEAVARVIEGRDGDRVEVGGPLYEGSGVATCVRIVQRIAEALAHAHERGVLHRDLKPSNVMLTGDGRALLFDFGLASSADAARLTGSGSRVGSPAYMSPEQVRGAETDERSDVYGLGTVLCEALTGRPPYVGSPETVGAAILRGDPVALRAHRSDLPRDVETIVQTALASRPAQRYAGAADMAQDLAAVLALRPIAARRAGPLLRSWRWTQRHPARAAALALVVLTPIALAIQQSLATRRITEQAARAEANLDHALESLERFVWGLGEGVFDHLPHLDDERIGLLEDTVASLGELIDQRPDDLHLRSRWVRMQGVLGGCYLQLGALDLAESRLEAAAEMGTAFGVPSGELVSVFNGLGNLLERQGRWREAFESYREAFERLGKVVDSEGLAAATVIERNTSGVQRQLGRLPEAAAAAEGAIKAAQLWLERAESDEDRFEARLALGAARNQRALVYVGSSTSGSFGPAFDPGGHAVFIETLPELLELAEERPRRSDATHLAAVACVNAHYHLSSEDVEPVLRKGLELIERLQRDFPDRVDYIRTHIGLASHMGHSLVLRQRVDDARVWFERASTEAQRGFADGSDDLDLLLDAGRADVNLATNLVQLEQREAACEPAARGGARLTEAWERMPDVPFPYDALAWARIQEGYGRLARGEGTRAYELALAVPEPAQADNVIAVAVGELFAGCADLAREPAERERLAGLALDQLQRGLDLGFTQFDYLRTTSEWASLRESSRFAALLEAASARAP